MTRDGPGRGSTPRAGSSGSQHTARAAGSPGGRPGAGRKPAKGQRSGSLQQQAPVYGAVPPPPSLHSDGLPSAGAGPLGSGVPRGGPYVRQRASVLVDGHQQGSAPAASGKPAAPPSGSNQSFYKPGLGSSRNSTGGSNHQQQLVGQASAGRGFVRSSNSTGGVNGSPNSARWAGTGGAGMFGQGACRMAYEADKEPDVWKVCTRRTPRKCTLCPGCP